MNIEINQAELDKAVNEHINRAVVSALTSYKIQDIVAEKISGEIVSVAIGTSLTAACEKG